MQNFYDTVFKLISGQLLLEEYLISITTAPVAITMNVSNDSYQKEFLYFFSFLRSAFSKFVEVSTETFIKNFLVLEFSVSSEF